MPDLTLERLEQIARRLKQVDHFGKPDGDALLVLIYKDLPLLLAYCKPMLEEAASR